ncbi:MAG: cysteine--tRNA ligase [Candidatus Levybacteria bacterium RIFCSPHIGHO2_01_FULL_36_15]|nr:MAG: cysteine--tRNA ligase [Candidatus Levybacteria bacterium RIFCSPHIGHO2_01_FULL_36_15]OGH38041.1 MAG: cysteine--tRNA ligase [Candidatus Levybacteria bacterium RIFCSPLOWO2_01_FULL_36_10]
MLLYNTLSRKIEEFKPLNPPHVGMYTCGPTVYRDIHIGNLRTYLTSDILKRALTLNGYKVISVMNITDVGHMRYSSEFNRQIDPVMEEALSEGRRPLEIAKNYTDKFLEDEKKINILPADVMPKATDHVKEMIEIIKVLIDKGFAYVTDGTVYFEVKKFREYGKLSGNTLNKMDQLLEAVRVSVETDKKDSADFALWKKAEEGRLMKWDSPWGEGFPGWHIECSAMSMKYLGRHFDIHAGGEDLIFPHHEDEIAQTEAFSGGKFVNFWIHTNYLLVDGEKMARSKGNVYLISDIEKKGFNPLAFRYLTFLAHYKARMNFTWKALEASQSALDKIYEAASGFEEGKIGCAQIETEFNQAVNDDLNMPKAVSVLWELLGSQNPTSAKAQSLYKMDEVLGLKIKETAESFKNIPIEIKEMAYTREKYRKENNFEKADALRRQIKEKGYTVKDTEKGSQIKKTHI